MYKNVNFCTVFYDILGVSNAIFLAALYIVANHCVTKA